MLKKKIVNVMTNEETYIDLTPDEIKEVELAQAEAAAKQAEAKAKETARLAVLEKLGLTADEVAALGI
jgi:hypothetical protein